MIIIITSEHTRISTLSVNYQLARGQPSPESPQVYDPEKKLFLLKMECIIVLILAFGGNEDEVSAQRILNIKTDR